MARSAVASGDTDACNRWTRRQRTRHAEASETFDPVLTTVALQCIDDHSSDKDRAQHEDDNASRADQGAALPDNLQALLDCDLDTISTDRTNSTVPVDGVVHLGGLMAQQGLFPRSKMASAQALISEHSLATSFNRVLQGGARHLRGVFGQSSDLGLFDALRKELGRGQGAWSRGTKGGLSQALTAVVCLMARLSRIFTARSSLLFHSCSAA